MTIATPQRNSTGPFTLIREHQRSYPIDVEALSQDFGLSIVKKDWPDEVSGAIGQDDRGYFIVVNAKHSETRQRFTIAHEIAHYILHRDRIGKEGIKESWLYRSTKMSDADERAANKLAAEILMPADMLGKAALAVGGLEDLSKLARELHVSKTALAIRLGVPT